MNDTILLSNSLTVLAERIREAISASAAAEKTAIEKALEAGHLLQEARTSCQHGEWLSFLCRVGMQERKAQRYIKLAWSGLKSDTVSDLGGIKATLRWLEGLRLPTSGECLIISLDSFAPGLKESLAVVWREGKKTALAVFVQQPTDSWIDIIRTSIIRTEDVLPEVYSALGNRFGEMSFRIVRDCGSAVEACR